MLSSTRPIAIHVMPARRSCGLALLAWIAVPGCYHLAVPPNVATTRPAKATTQLALMAEELQLLNRMTQLRNEGRSAQAIPLAERYADLERQRFGADSTDYATALCEESVYCRLAGMYARSETLCMKAMVIQKRLLGESNLDYAWSLDNLGMLYDAMGCYARAEQPFRQACDIRLKALGEQNALYAQCLDNLGVLFQHRGDFPQALEYVRKATEIRKLVLGERDTSYATSLNNLGVIYSLMGLYAQSEKLLVRSRDIRRELVGEAHPDYAVSLNNLAFLYDDMGDYAHAEPLYQQASEIMRKAKGEQHPDYATCLDNLGAFYAAMADYVRAEPLYRKSLKIRGAALGENHPDYATSLANLAGLYSDMDDDDRAEPLYIQALKIRLAVLGKDHPECADSWNTLAGLCAERGDYVSAEQMYQRALDIRRVTLGKHHRDYAASLNNLGYLYWKTGDYARAERFYRESMEIWREAVGEQHPYYAKSLSNLAYLDYERGDYAGAKTLFQKASEIQRASLGEHHPAYAACLSDLACLYRAMGDDAQAIRLALQTVAITARQTDQVAAVQSERQQLLSVNAEGGDANVLLTVSADEQSGEAYDAVLPIKGLVSLRQQEMRAVHGPAADPATAGLRADLRAASALLSRLSRASAVLPATRPAATELADARAALDQQSDRVEQFQRDLAAKDAVYRQSRERLHRTAAAGAAALPTDAVLVDVREYTPLWTAAQRKAGQPRVPRLAAFVVRHGQPVARVELGPTAPVEEQVEAWRRTFGAGTSGAEAGTKLRALIWQPLLDQARPQMVGATTVLLSPDGPLCRFPLAALPGNEPGTFLMEDVGVAVVPVPQLLPELANKLAESATGGLLLVGGVDFDASPGAATTRPAMTATTEPTVELAATAPPSVLALPRGGPQRHWPPLAGTRVEADDVGRAFERRFPSVRPTKLPGAAATKAAVRAALEHCRYAHLATHGYFAPADVPNALAPTTGPSASDRIDPFVSRGVTGFHPGLLSGLCFAGANREPKDGEEDGILTALEAEELDLSGLDLAVLSACQTGLGQSAGGEGLLGLQRAFAVAGARTTIATLWTIDDAATAALMGRFYDNLWGQHMGKLAALREAQLWMLKQARDGTGPARGLDGAGAATRPARPSAYLWAGFVLSGDWR
jgi:CHAT domain-containing protein